VKVGLQVVGVIVVISVVNPLFLIPSVFIAVLLFITRNYFQKTSRNLKRLESSGKCQCLGVREMKRKIKLCHGFGVNSWHFTYSKKPSVLSFKHEPLWADHS
jgi:hypothetical protein